MKRERHFYGEFRISFPVWEKPCAIVVERTKGQSQSQSTGLRYEAWTLVLLMTIGRGL